MEKQQVTYKGNPIRLTADLSAETQQARKEWQDIFKVLKGKNLQPRLLYLARISFKTDGEISFSDKQNLGEFSTTKPALQQMLKGLIQSRNTKEEEISTKSINPKQLRKQQQEHIITLNVNGLNAATKRHRLDEGIQKQDTYVCCLQETHFRPQHTYRLKVKGRKNIFLENGKQNKAGAAVLISDKMHLKIKKITRDKEGCYIMIKGSI